MGVALYPHNERAYGAVRRLLAEKGRAAVVHPTGTGKSFIAFRLVEENASARFVWLSPSEYIFKTQLENVKRSDPDFPAEAITFLTYAKLMMMGGDEIADLSLDCIVLDEFHRCGAEMWGQGVARLLGAYPQAKLLGLSATAVRYLDDQRDMAEELFGGDVASEMSLGEAIVRGILPAPKYVTTVYKYQQDLDYWQARVNGAKAFGIRDEAQKYLDALRRALEQADGLDVIFQRHITKNGKYIVFCANVEHMREMQSHVTEWFGGIDAEPHCYTVYSGDPSTSKEFSSFKQDNSGHLKLLFCVDMLNEGIHVAGISGVILFRPTVSPTIYKQQIGRALTAGDEATPLVLDVVNNVENLLSIGALQEEMSTAIQRMYLAGEGSEIVTERFQVVEQVRDCRQLFEQLHNALTGTWEQYYQAASAFYAEHGHLRVPKKYVANGLSLGSWITTQRLVRAGRQAGRLTEEQVARLDSIGMVWANRLETAWERNFRYAEDYYKEHGDLLVPVKYVTADGVRLGKWISNLRDQYANGEKRAVLTEERIQRLNEIGMQWDVHSVRWEQNYLEALRYYRENGNLNVPVGYKTDTGFNLGAWVRNLRQARQGRSRNRPLTAEQIARLDAVGMQWSFPQKHFQKNPAVPYQFYQ